MFPGEAIILTSSGPWPDIILTAPPRYFRGCYVGACPYLDDEPEPAPGSVCEEGWTEWEWVPGKGFVRKS